MKPLHSLLLPLTAVGVLMFPSMSPAASPSPIDSAGVLVQRQEQNGIAYLSGGIGEDESKAIQQTTGYNLHMTFSVGSQNEYIPDVSVVIQKAPGQTVLTLNDALDDKQRQALQLFINASLRATADLPKARRPDSGETQQQRKGGMGRQRESAGGGGKF